MGTGNCSFPEEFEQVKFNLVYKIPKFNYIALLFAAMGLSAVRAYRGWLT